MVGIARAFAYNPKLVSDWKADKSLHIKITRAAWKDKAVASLAGMAMTKQQLYRLGDGLPLKPKQNALFSLLGQQIKTGKLTKRYKVWLDKQT